MSRALAAALALAAGTAAAQSQAAPAASLTALQGEAARAAEALRAVNVRGVTPQEAARRIKETASRWAASPGASPQLKAALAHLAGLADDWPNRRYCRLYPRQTLLALARQVEVSARKASSPAEVESFLRADLVLPLDADLESLFPTDMTLKRYKALGPILIWLLKHRQSTPPSYKPMAVDDIFARQEADDMIVESGVSLKGTVSAVSRAEDGDLCFDVGPSSRAIEVEITPDWRALHPTNFPRVGDNVEVFGWSYFDSFHRDEIEGEKDVLEERPGAEKGKRATLWEVHPAHVVNVLPK